jgi:hypothetical protein
VVTTNQGTVTVTVTGCLFSNNLATGPSADSQYMKGAGMYVNHVTTATGSASFTIRNSTLIGNNSDNHGGGLALENSKTGTGTNTASLTSLTMYQNLAITDGGGLWINVTGAAAPQVWNSIIAGNQNETSANNGYDVFGPVSSQGFNLIGQTEGSSGWRSSDYKGSAANPLDPKLDTHGLQDNGGPTQTIKLLTTSQGYENGDPTLANASDPLNKDQRGYTRQQNKVSIGAYDPDAVAP